MVSIIEMHLVFFTMINHFTVGVISVIGHLAKMESLQLLYEFTSLFHLNEPVASSLKGKGG